jgi:hypothetical protein
MCHRKVYIYTCIYIYIYVCVYIYIYLNVKFNSGTKQSKHIIISNMPDSNDRELLLHEPEGDCDKPDN